MKRLNYILITLALLCTACSDWLDVQPRTEIKEEDIYAGEKGFKSVLDGVYIQLASKELYGINMSVYFPDLLAQLWYNQYETTERRVAAFDFTHQNVEPVIEQIWKKYYTCVGHLNNLLYNLEHTDVKFSFGNKELIRGEAYGLRAFIHLELLRMFGPVPEGATDGMPAIPYVEELTRQPLKLLTLNYGEVKRRIVRDLDTAAVYLKNDPFILGGMYDFNNPGNVHVTYEPLDTWHYYRQTHFNCYAVKAAKARFYQWIGEPAKANELALEVIGVKNPDGTDKFVLANESNSYSTGSGANLVMQCEHLLAVNCSNHQKMVEGILTEGTKSAKLLSRPADINKIYENTVNPGDIRNVSGRYWKTDNSRNLSLKYIGSGNIKGINMIPLMRLSEMYLILLENLPATEAASWFTAYRQARAMSVNVIFNEATQAERVEMEFRKEFMGEGQMFFYYKRHNTLSYSIPGKFTVPANGYVIPKPKSQTMFE